jgi:methylmalonyl-CoA mutase
MTDPETLPLAADFPWATTEDWRKLVDAVLKGAPFERLVSTTYDGLRIEPLAARRTDARPIAARAGATAWEVLARIDHPDPALANEIAQRELANGANGLALVFAGAVGDYGFGLPPTREASARVLEGIDPSAGIAIELNVWPQTVTAIENPALVGPALAPPAMSVRIGHDPLGAMTIVGSAARKWNEEAPHFARRLAALAREGFQGKLAVADGRVIHNAGGSEAQELAFVLGVALAYLRALETEGVALETARRMIFFRLCADVDQFLTIAKVRALRKLWTRVEASCGLAPEQAFISAETAWRMMAQRDPHVNILRAAIAVSAAAFGGADAITVLPFTVARGLPDEFARRIARNTQLILIEEAHLANVADPAAGSGAVENLTDQLCQAAWALFHEIEAAGGTAAALESGLIQGKVAAVRAKRAAALARRRDALTGVSAFPNLHEAEVAVMAVAEHKHSPAPQAGKVQMFAPLPAIRLAQPFEALRDASDRLLAATGARPKIFLANLGAPADFSARATFAKNFFEAGGIEPVGCESRDAPALATACKAAGTALVCLCSTDKVYEKQAPAAAAALKAAGAQHIYLAGRPGEREAAWRAAGVQSFIYEGCDALATLEGAYDILGIEIG